MIKTRFYRRNKMSETAGQKIQSDVSKAETNSLPQRKVKMSSIVQLLYARADNTVESDPRDIVEATPDKKQDDAQYNNISQKRDPSEKNLEKSQSKPTNHNMLSQAEKEKMADQTIHSLLKAELAMQRKAKTKLLQAIRKAFQRKEVKIAYPNIQTRLKKRQEYINSKQKD